MQAVPSRGFQRGPETVVFSLETEGMPLMEVLEKISRLTGYKILVNSACPQLPVTVHLEDVSLFKALKIILGKLNYAIVEENKEKTIELTLYGFDSSQNLVKGAVMHRRERVDLMDLKLIASDIPGKIVKVVGVDNLNLKDFDALNVEVIPPEIPGEIGKTLKEIEDSRLDGKEPERVVLYGGVPAVGAKKEAGIRRRDGAHLLDLKVITADSRQEEGARGNIIESYDLSGEKSKPLHVELSPPDIAVRVPEEG